MSKMTINEEIGVRIKALHRKNWLNKLGTEDGFGISNTPLVVGPLTIHKAVGTWTVIMSDTIVYYEQLRGDVSVEESLVEELLRILRAAMVLDDLADV